MQFKQPTLKDQLRLPLEKAKKYFVKNRKSIIIAAIIVLALAPSVFFFNKSRNAEQKLQAPENAKMQVVNEVVEEVQKHMLLPKTEQPTLATINNPSEVKNQPFFKDAVKGDKILVYADARIVILYRPSIDRIVAVTTLQLDPNN